MSILTPTIPERAFLLRECEASVGSQTFTDWEHFTLLDEERAGCAVTLNKIAALAKGEWLLLLADDDLLLPGCIQTLLNHSADADVVYAPPLVWGEDPAQFISLPPPNIPSTALIRTSLWRDLGGYGEGWQRTEDRDFYERALLRGARFVRTDNGPTWVYRFWGGNKSRQPVSADR